MPILYNEKKFQLHEDAIARAIIKGSVFIYPTDTIYGLGCDATNPSAVARLRQIKNRPSTPFSIIAPSMDWIEDNCDIPEEMKDWVKKLPGPLTLLLPLKNKEAVAPNVAPEKETIGIRLPKHWFTKFVKTMGHPIITTSVNKTGEPHMTSLEQANAAVIDAVDFVIDEGEKKGTPSKIIQWDGSKIIINERS